MGHGLSRIFAVTSVIAGIGLWCMMGGVAVLVVDRNVLQRGMPWVYDLLLWLLVATVYLGAVRVSWRNQHISMDALYLRLPRTVRTWVDVASAMLSMLFAVSLVLLARPQVVGSFASGQTTQSGAFPAWIGHAILPVCFLLIAIAYGAYSIYRVRGRFAAPESTDTSQDPVTRSAV